jgi:hypothetical protein
MFPVFVDTGHANYAVRGRIYMQLICELLTKHLFIYSKFVNGHNIGDETSFTLDYLGSCHRADNDIVKKRRGNLNRDCGLQDCVRITCLSTMTNLHLFFLPYQHSMVI